MSLLVSLCGSWRILGRGITVTALVRKDRGTRKLMSPVQVVCLDSDSEPDERQIVRLDSDSESDVSRTILLDDTGDEAGGVERGPLAIGNQRKRSRNGQRDGSGLGTAEDKARVVAQKQAEKEAEKQRKLEARALDKFRKEEEKKARLESNRLKREEEKQRREEAKIEAAERRKLEQEKKKWEKGKFAVENTIAHIDSKVLEKGKIGGALLTRLGEKSMKFNIGSNPISKTIIWSSKRPCEDTEEDLELPTQEAGDDSSQPDPFRNSQLQLEDFEIPYVLVVLEGEEFSNMVAANVVHAHVQSIQQLYPGFTVCYLVNNLMRYLHQRDQAQYKQASGSWVRPPVEQALAQFMTHHVGVHSRLCLDEAEVADHIVGLMQNLAAVPFKRRLSALSISQNGELVAKNDPNRALVKKSTWLRALVALPRLSGACAVAIGKKYPNMRALLDVYLDPSMTVRDKEFLLEDLVKEGPIGSVRSRVRVGPACSKRVYRILMAQKGDLLTEEVEEGAAMFDD